MRNKQDKILTVIDMTDEQKEATANGGELQFTAEQLNQIGDAEKDLRIQQKHDNLILQAETAYGCKDFTTDGVILLLVGLGQFTHMNGLVEGFIDHWTETILEDLRSTNSEVASDTRVHELRQKLAKLDEEGIAGERREEALMLVYRAVNSQEEAKNSIDQIADFDLSYYLSEYVNDQWYERTNNKENLALAYLLLGLIGSWDNQHTTGELVSHYINAHVIDWDYIQDQVINR